MLDGKAARRVDKMRSRLSEERRKKPFRTTFGARQAVVARQAPEHSKPFFV